MQVADIAGRAHALSARTESQTHCVPVAIPEVRRALLEAISDEFSRKIMSSTISEGKSMEEIATGSDIPLSTAYKRVRELSSSGIVVVERIVSTGTGTRHLVYRSAFREVRIDVKSGFLSVEVAPNEPVADRVYRKWQSMLLDGLNRNNGDERSDEKLRNAA